MLLVCGTFDLFYSEELNGIHITVEPAELGQIKGHTVLTNSTDLYSCLGIGNANKWNKREGNQI